MKDCVEDLFREGWMTSNVRAPKGLKAVRDGQLAFSEETIFSPGELDRAPIQKEFFDRYDLRYFFGFDFVPGQILANIERGRHRIADWELNSTRCAASSRTFVVLASSPRGRFSRDKQAHLSDNLSSLTNGMQPLPAEVVQPKSWPGFAPRTRPSVRPAGTCRCKASSASSAAMVAPGPR